MAINTVPLFLSRGLSDSEKIVALKTLEDVGHDCVDSRSYLTIALAAQVDNIVRFISWENSHNTPAHNNKF